MRICDEIKCTFCSNNKSIFSNSRICRSCLKDNIRCCFKCMKLESVNCRPFNNEIENARTSDIYFKFLIKEKEEQWQD
jgi:hypothetical protein